MRALLAEYVPDLAHLFGVRPPDFPHYTPVELAGLCAVIDRLEVPE